MFLIFQIEKNKFLKYSWYYIWTVETKESAGWLFLVLIPFMVGRINLLLSPEFFFVEENWLIIKTFISTLSEEEGAKVGGEWREETQVHDVVGKTGKKKGVSFLQIRTHTKKLCELRKWTRVVKMPKTSPHPIFFFFLPPSILWLNTQCSFPTLYREKRIVNEEMKKFLYSLKMSHFT